MGKKQIKSYKVPDEWWQKFLDPKEWKDDPKWVEGYNAALKDFQKIFGIKKNQESTIYGTVQIDTILEKMKLQLDG